MDGTKYIQREKTSVDIRTWFEVFCYIRIVTNLYSGIYIDPAHRR